MNIVLWLCVGVCLALSGGPITHGGTRRVDEKQLANLQRRAGLPLPPMLRGPVLRRISSHERWTVTGGLSGVAIGAIGAIISVLLPMTWEGVAGVVVLASGGFFAASGGVIAVSTNLRQTSPDTPRVARSTAVALADYLPHGELASRRLAPVLAVFAGLLGFGLLLFVSPSDWLGKWLWMVPVSIGLTLVVTVAVALVSRRVLERGQEATSDLDLAWDDLVRAQALRGLSGNVIALGALSVSASFAMVGDTVIRPGTRAGAEQLTLILGAVALGLASLLLLWLLIPVLTDRIGLTPPLRHVLTRLWPDAPFRRGGPPQVRGDRTRAG